MPASSILDTWSSDPWSDGVQIDRMNDLQSLRVLTQNHTYEIIIISGRTGDVLVRGGKFFPTLTPARLSGSTLGGCFIKMRGIYVGFRMEFHVMEFEEHQRRITTSTVRSIGPVV